MITILTHSPVLFSKENIKAKVKKLIGSKRGPAAVAESLRKGLTENKAQFQIDPPQRLIGNDIVHVLSGADALRYAIQLKKEGKIRKLITGPNVSVFPEDHGGVLLAPEIDMILQPSRWTRDLYTTLAPSLEGKIRIWPAGVTDPGETPRRGNMVLIFQKNAPEELLLSVQAALSKNGIEAVTIKYGSFEKEDYFKLLESCDAMIYLSQSESQGLALNEAWIRDVPTLVWNRGYFEYGDGKRFEAEAVSAPLLSPETGMFFKNAEDFETRLEAFLKAKGGFSPRKHSLSHFTDQKTALAYLGLIM